MDLISCQYMICPTVWSWIDTFQQLCSSSNFVLRDLLIQLLVKYFMSINQLCAVSPFEDVVYYDTVGQYTFVFCLFLLVKHNNNIFCIFKDLLKDI